MQAKVRIDGANDARVAFCERGMRIVVRASWSRISLLFTVALLGCVGAYGQQSASYVTHSWAEFSAFSLAHTPIFIADASKSLRFANPTLTVSNGDYSNYLEKQIGWTDGRRAFSLSVSLQGLITWGLENEGGGMDTISLSLPSVGGQMKSLWLSASTEEANSTAVLQIDTFNGAAVPSGTPDATNRNVEEGMPAVEVYGFLQASPLTVTGWIQDPSDPFSTRTTDFEIMGYDLAHVPEIGTSALLAGGTLLSAGSRRGARRVIAR